MDHVTEKLAQIEEIIVMQGHIVTFAAPYTTKDSIASSFFDDYQIY